MNGDRPIPTSPTFFRLIGRAVVIAAGCVALLALVIPAPLDEGADPSTVPNPAKAGWFLLWIQEVVSWSTLTVYPLLAAAAILLFLPWLTKDPPPDHASWFPGWNRWHRWFVAVFGLLILSLTILALLFRGENWRLVVPWGG